MEVKSDDCPPNPSQMIMLCAQGLGYGPSVTLSVAEDLERKRKACQGSELVEVVNCIESIMKKCQGLTQREHILKSTLDPRRIKLSVQEFCDNFQVYEEHAQCIQDQHPKVNNCSKEAQISYKIKVEAADNVDVLLLGACRYHQIAGECLSTIVYDNCGDCASQIAMLLVKGFEPPMCIENESGDNRELTHLLLHCGGSSPTFHIHSILGILIENLLLIFFVRFLWR